MKKLKQYVKFKKLEDEIEFVGLVDNVEKYLSETDIFILPSKYEGMPMSIIEAMATGLPIVASNVGGIPDMIESGKEGILIEPFAINLAMELEKLLQSEKIRNQLGNAAYEKSFEYSVIKMAERYVEVYKV